MARTFRSYSAASLVQLPRLDKSSAQALGTQTITVARGKELPFGVKDALEALDSALQNLNQTAVLRLPILAEDANLARAKDSQIDAAWSGIYSFLEGWAKHSWLPQAEVATNLLNQIFPDGLRFLQLPFKLEWAESNTRIVLIGGAQLDSAFQGLGGGPLLESLRLAHKEYGEALGITEWVETTTETASLREAMDLLVDALRDYVVKVSASVSKRDPKTAELADQLLAPIVQWQSQGSSSASTEDPPAPTPTPAPLPTPAPPPASSPFGSDL